MIADLVAAGADPDARDPKGQTPLDLAIQYRRVRMSSRPFWMPERTRGRGGADTSGGSHSPLHLAAMMGDSTLVTLLLEAGAARTCGTRKVIRRSTGPPRAFDGPDCGPVPD